MKVKVTGEAGVEFDGKNYGKGEELNVPGEQAQIWMNLDLVSHVKGQSASKKGVGNGKGQGAAKSAAKKSANATAAQQKNAERKAGKVKGNDDVSIPTEELG